MDGRTFHESLSTISCPTRTELGYVAYTPSIHKAESGLHISALREVSFFFFFFESDNLNFLLKLNVDHVYVHAPSSRHNEVSMATARKNP